MENKYYPPEIEEFHIGFEYEEFTSTYKDREQKWRKEVYSDCMYADYDGSSLFNQVKKRVKYLDKEDIESLGFKALEDLSFKYTDNNRFKDSFILFMHPDIGKVYVKIYVDFNTHEVVIDNIGAKYPGRSFSGVIKNKSEFNKILKQLNICQQQVQQQ